MYEITALVESLLPDKTPKRYKTCCGGVPPINDEGDVVVCDHCSGLGYYEIPRKYYAITDETKHLPTVNIVGVGDVAYIDIE